MFPEATQATLDRLLASAAIQAGADPPPRPHGGYVLQALVVEDSAPIRERLIEMLSWPGEMRVAALAASEDEALAQCAAPMDLAIVDLQLARGTGFSVIRRLRQLHGAQPVIVVFTNHAIPALRIAAFEAGADYFLDKSRDAGDIARIAADLVAARHGHPRQRGVPSM